MSKFLALIILLLVAISVVPLLLEGIINQPVIGYDWINTFYAGAKAWKAPWTVGLATMYPQWTLLALVPLTLLPTYWGYSILVFLTLSILVIYVRDWWRALLLVLSFPVLDCLVYGQIEGLLVLAFMVPLEWGIVIASLKPPFLCGWVFGQWLRNGRGRTLLPMILVLVGAFIIWGWWPGKLSFDQLAAPISIDLWPWGVPIGLGLLFTENPGLWLLAGCLMTPYLLFHHLTPLMAWIYKRKSPAFLLCLTILSWIVAGKLRGW